MKGLVVDESKIVVIQQWTQLWAMTEVQSFHGLVYFYRCLISNFNSVTAPSIDCIKGQTVVWTIEVEDAVQKIKKLLKSAPVLV